MIDVSKSFHQCKKIFAVMLMMFISFSILAQERKLSFNGITVPDDFLNSTILSSAQLYGSARTFGDVMGEPLETTAITNLTVSKNKVHIEATCVLMNLTIDVQFSGLATCFISYIKIESPMTFETTEASASSPNGYSYGKVLGLFQSASLFFKDKIAEAEKKAEKEKRLAEEKAAAEAKAELTKKVEIWKQSGVPADNIEEFIEQIKGDYSVDTLKIIGFSKDWGQFFYKIQDAMVHKDIKIRFLDLSETEGLTYIPYGIFNNYPTEYFELEKITFPSTLKEIGDLAFQGCKIKSIVFPDGLEEIGFAAFQYCPLESISFPKSLKTIGKMAFSNCSLENIELPDSLEYVGGDAFRDCKLKSIVLPKNTGNSFDIVNFFCSTLESITITNEKQLIPYHDNYQVSYSSKFRSLSSLENISFSQKIKVIPSYAFADCAIKNVTMPESLQEIGQDAFKNCSIENLTIPKTLKVIRQDAFLGCPIKNITFNGSKKQWKAINIEDKNIKKALKQNLVTFTEE